MISEYFILTAAHCVHQALRIEVRLAYLSDTDFGDVRHLSGGNNIYIPDGYNPRTRENDIALVELYLPVPFNSLIKVIQLSCVYAQPNTRVQIAGKGITADHHEQSKVLKYADMMTISNEQCAESLANIFPSKLCALNATTQAGTCHGDAGSALVKMGNGRTRYQIGVAIESGNGGSCQQGLPDTYTRISSFLPWILQHVKSIKCDPNE